MPIPTELQALSAKLSAEDQALLDGILGRSPDLATDLIARDSLYQAFVTGDDTQLPGRTAAVAPGTARAAAADIDALLPTIERRIANKYDQQITDLNTKFAAIDVEKQAEAIFDRVFAAKSKEFESDLLGKAAQTSDSIYQIRRSHEKEFGNELDTTKFTEFIKEHPGYKTLAEAHDAMVQDERIQARIDKGVADKLAAQATSSVPGAELPKDGPLGLFIADNAKRAAAASGSVSRGEGLDAAVKMFSTLRNAQPN